MDKIPITKNGLAKLKKELKHIKNVERKQIIAEIKSARALGDLSENAEYHAAKDKQGFNEGRIRELENRIARTEVVDIQSISENCIRFGATVTLSEEESYKENTYQIVGEDEANIELGRLSISAPISQALIGKTVGDSAEFTTPKGRKSYEIIKIIYK